MKVKITENGTVVTKSIKGHFAYDSSLGVLFEPGDYISYEGMEYLVVSSYSGVEPPNTSPACKSMIKVYNDSSDSKLVDTQYLIATLKKAGVSNLNGEVQNMNSQAVDLDKIDSTFNFFFDKNAVSIYNLPGRLEEYRTKIEAAFVRNYIGNNKKFQELFVKFDSSANKSSMKAYRFKVGSNWTNWYCQWI